jgi:acyl-[acyl carrier protein]--UDP-N-acetylglucosamine O-acyltransferase
MSEAYDRLRKKYKNIFRAESEIFESKAALEEDLKDYPDVGVAFDRVWEEEGFLLAELVDNNMWSEVVVIKK